MFRLSAFRIKVGVFPAIFFGGGGSQHYILNHAYITNPTGTRVMSKKKDIAVEIFAVRQSLFNSDLELCAQAGDGVNYPRKGQTVTVHYSGYVSPACTRASGLCPMHLS